MKAPAILKYMNYVSKLPKVYLKKRKRMMKMSPAISYLEYRFKDFRRKTNIKIVVDTIYGKVQGVKRLTCWEIPYFSFEKVPFAKPPLRELRFKDPETPDPWRGELDCTNEAPLPIQIDPHTQKLVGSEDCLYLSVFTKDVKPTVLKPVLVWIHGGDFMTGGPSRQMYGPDYFMLEDIVLVLIGYRLGPFGFLSLNDPSLLTPGNAGLKDQVLALKWVEKNIINFGGDPLNVTVFGADAGAASTHYMGLTSQTRNIFHKAILMSGSVFSHFSLVTNHNFPYRLAQKLGYRGKPSDPKVLNFLLNANAEYILRASRNLTSPEEENELIHNLCGPVIEPYITDNCVIPMDPRIMARDAWSNDIPFMVGGTSFEGLYFYPKLRRNSELLNILNDCKYIVPNDLKLDRNGETCAELGERIRQEHLRNKYSTVENLLDMMSYKLFWHSLHRTILSRSIYAPGPTYLYRFDACVPGLNYFQEVFCRNEIPGVAHSDDISYLFKNMFLPQLKSIRGFDLIYKMVHMRAIFAETGNPNTNLIHPTKWYPIQGDPPFKCLNISDQDAFIDLPESKTLEVWDSLYPHNTLI